MGQPTFHFASSHHENPVVIQRVKQLVCSQTVSIGEKFHTSVTLHVAASGFKQNFHSTALLSDSNMKWLGHLCSGKPIGPAVFNEVDIHNGSRRHAKLAKRSDDLSSCLFVLSVQK